MGRQIESIPSEAMEALVQYPWPGNVRELENVIERAVILSARDVLHINPAELQGAGVRSQESGVRSQESGNGAVSLADAEREHILAALRAANGVLGGPNGAAARLAMKRTTLQSKMKKLGISTRES
jgi:formate hydrogenlyase transcriptional activator